MGTSVPGTHPGPADRRGRRPEEGAGPGVLSWARSRAWCLQRGRLRTSREGEAFLCQGAGAWDFQGPSA